jgi:hypothetical protein
MKKIIILIMALMFSQTFIISPAFAKCPEGSVPVSILDAGDDTVTGTEGERCVKDDKAGSGVFYILNFILDIMTMGVGILAIIGITIAGATYLSAGGNEGKTRLAKQRILEIVIGLVAYAVIYAALKWLLPSFGS